MTEQLIGSFFEDTIDGYFPLRESLRQMMERNAFDNALIRMIHAPAMDIPGLGADEPVPLYIVDHMSCMIHHMTLLIQYSVDTLHICGVAEWQWEGNYRAGESGFAMGHRLAEPALVRGIQWSASRQDHESESMGEDNLHLRLQWLLTKNAIVQGECRVGHQVIEAIPVQNALSASKLSGFSGTIQLPFDCPASEPFDEFI